MTKRLIDWVCVPLLWGCALAFGLMAAGFAMAQDEAGGELQGLPPICLHLDAYEYLLAVRQEGLSLLLGRAALAGNMAHLNEAKRLAEMFIDLDSALMETCPEMVAD